jgi:hypothetical protein
MTFPSTDSLILGGDRLPGVWHLLPGAKEFGWQEQKGTGLTGATLRPIGDPLVTCEFLVQFFRESDWDDFQPFRAKYFRKPVVTQGTKSNYAIPIQHPELHANGIDAVVLVKVPFFTNTGKGNWVGHVHFKQYRKPIPALESPRAKLPSVTKKPPVAQTALEQEIAQKTSQLLGARGQ